MGQVGTDQAGTSAAECRQPLARPLPRPAASSIPTLAAAASLRLARARRRLVGGGGSGDGARRRQAPDRRERFADRIATARPRSWPGSNADGKLRPELRRGWRSPLRLSVHGGELGAARAQGCCPSAGSRRASAASAASSARTSRSAPASRGRGRARSAWTCRRLLRLRRGLEAATCAWSRRQHARANGTVRLTSTEGRALQAAPAVRRIRAGRVPAGDAAPGRAADGSVLRANAGCSSGSAPASSRTGTSTRWWQKVTRRVASGRSLTA